MSEITFITARPRDPATGIETVVRMAGGGSHTPYFDGANHYLAGLVNRPRFTARIGFDEKGWTGSAVPTTAPLIFMPSTAAKREELNALAWRDATIEIDGGEEGTALSRKLTGIVADQTVRDGAIILTVADLAHKLAKPFLTETFDGSGGIEGPAEAEGRAKRRSWGMVFNIPGRVLDEVNNIWEFGDPAHPIQEYVAVKDMGRAGPMAIVAWQGSIASTFAALQTSAPADGGCTVAPSINCVKWWTQPQGPLTADLKGENTGGYVDKAASIAGKIVAAASGPAMANQAEAEAWRTGEAGLHVASLQETTAQALDRLLLGVSLVWIMEPAGLLRIRQFAFDESAEALQGLFIGRETTLPPMKTRRVGYRRNHHVHSDGEISAAILADDVVLADGSGILIAINQAQSDATAAGADATSALGLLDTYEDDGYLSKSQRSELNLAINRLIQSRNKMRESAAAIGGLTTELAAEADAWSGASGFKTYLDTLNPPLSSTSATPTPISTTTRDTRGAAHEAALAALQKAIDARSAALADFSVLDGIAGNMVANPFFKALRGDGVPANWYTSENYPSGMGLHILKPIDGGGGRIGDGTGDSTFAIAGTPVRVEAGQQLRVIVALKGEVASANGLYLRIQESNDEAAATAKYVGTASGEAGGIIRDSYTDIDDETVGQVSNDPVPGTLTYYSALYTVPAGVKYISPSLYNWSGHGTNYIDCFAYQIVNIATRNTGAANADGLDAIDAGGPLFVGTLPVSKADEALQNGNLILNADGSASYWNGTSYVNIGAVTYSGLPGTPVSLGDISAEEQAQLAALNLQGGVTWQRSGTQDGDVRIVGSSVERLTGNVLWNSTVISREKFSRGFVAHFIAGDVSQNCMLGVTLQDSITPTTAEYNQNAFAFYCASGLLRIYEGSSYKGEFVNPIADGAALRMELSDGELRYYHEDTLIRTVAVTPGQSYRLFCSMLQSNSGCRDAKAGNFVDGDKVAGIAAGADVTGDQIGAVGRAVLPKEYRVFDETLYPEVFHDDCYRGNTGIQNPYTKTDAYKIITEVGGYNALFGWAASQETYGIYLEGGKKYVIDLHLAFSIGTATDARWNFQIRRSDGTFVHTDINRYTSFNGLIELDWTGQSSDLYFFRLIVNRTSGAAWPSGTDTFFVPYFFDILPMIGNQLSAPPRDIRNWRSDVISATVGKNADETAENQIHLEGPRSHTILRDDTLTEKSGEQPVVLKYTLWVGGVDRSADASWSVVDPAGWTTPGTPVSSTGSYTITDANGIAGTATITANYNGKNYPIEMKLGFKDDPPSTGSGANSAQDSSLANINSGTYVQMTDDLAVIAADSSNTLSHSANYRNDTGSAALQTRWRVSTDGGGSWSTVTGSEHTGGTAFSTEPSNSIDSVAHSVTAGNAYLYRLEGRFNGGSGSGALIMTSGYGKASTA